MTTLPVSERASCSTPAWDRLRLAPCNSPNSISCSRLRMQRRFLFRGSVHGGQLSSRRSARQIGRRCQTRVSSSASSEAAEYISRGQKKFETGDRMGALMLFEEALKKSPSKAERQAILFNSTAVHASFGDVELAQITLREGINCGLDFEAALKSSSDSQLVNFQGSPQIIIQLRKFAEAVRRIKGAVAPADKAAAAPGPGSRNWAAASRDSYLDRDISGMLRTEVTGIDPSIGGIIRRVAVLLLVGLVLGAALFYVGLQLTFPSYE